MCDASVWLAPKDSRQNLRQTAKEGGTEGEDRREGRDQPQGRAGKKLEEEEKGQMDGMG